MLEERDLRNIYTRYQVKAVRLCKPPTFARPPPSTSGHGWASAMLTCTLEPSLWTEATVPTDTHQHSSNGGLPPHDEKALPSCPQHMRTRNGLRCKKEKRTWEARKRTSPTSHGLEPMTPAHQWPWPFLPGRSLTCSVPKGGSWPLRCPHW